MNVLFSERRRVIRKEDLRTYSCLYSYFCKLYNDFRSNFLNCL